jgi:hypothetical protein
MHRRLGLSLLLLGTVVALAACGSPASRGVGSASRKASVPPTTTTTTTTSAPPATETSAPPTTGAASTITVNGFSYSVAVGPIQRSIYNQGGVPAPPGEHWWQVNVVVRNVQTDREAPILPTTQALIISTGRAPCPNPGEENCYVGLEAPSDSQYAYGTYFNPGQTIQILYDSATPLPDTLSPSSFAFDFNTEGQSVKLDVPS